MTLDLWLKNNSDLLDLLVNPILFHEMIKRNIFTKLLLTTIYQIWIRLPVTHSRMSALNNIHRIAARRASAAEVAPWQRIPLLGRLLEDRIQIMDYMLCLVVWSRMLKRKLRNSPINSKAEIDTSHLKLISNAVYPNLQHHLTKNKK